MPISRARDLLVLAVSIALALPGIATAQAHPLPGLDAYVESAMRDWEVPGLAIAVVRNDSVIFARGYGVREIDRPAPVDENTLFAIASTTKAFTAAGLGLLVDQGTLEWDDPVSKWLPELQLSDPFVTRELTIRDLLTHRIGIERADMLWIAGPFDRPEILRRVRDLPAASSFRSAYGYNNLMYIAAGEVLAAASGTSWDDFVESRLFRPLGMTRSTVRAAEVERRENVAGSHTRIDGTVTQVPRRDYTTLGSAGAAYSSVADLSRWVRMHINGGTIDGRRILEEETVRELHEPQVIVPTDSVGRRLHPHTRFRTYALGWWAYDYHGRKLVHHSGNVNWTRTQIGMIPEEGLGVVIIANLSSSNLQHALMYRVLDQLMGLPERDWSAEYLALQRRSEARGEERSAEREAARVAGTRPSLPLDGYAGTYEQELFGEMRVRREGDRLVLDYNPEYVADLEHWHFDTFRAVWRRPGHGTSFVTFTLGPDADVTEMDVEDFGELRPVRAEEEEGG
jgi:CubicO group peptidase (beta-lactamase class C family)